MKKKKAIKPRPRRPRKTYRVLVLVRGAFAEPPVDHPLRAYAVVEARDSLRALRKFDRLFDDLPVLAAPDRTVEPFSSDHPADRPCRKNLRFVFA